MRKNTKTILIIVLLCFTILVMVGCDQSFRIHRMSDEVVIGVELIYYDNPEARSNPSEAFPLDLGKIEVLEVLDPSMIDSFVDAFDISTIGGLDRQTLFSHDGIGVRFIHEDGSFEIVTLTTVYEDKQPFVTYYDNERFFMGLYDSTGNVIRTEDMAAAMPMGGSTGERLFDRFYILLDEYFTVPQNLDGKPIEGN